MSHFAPIQVIIDQEGRDLCSLNEWVMPTIHVKCKSLSISNNTDCCRMATIKCQIQIIVSNQIVPRRFLFKIWFTQKILSPEEMVRNLRTKPQFIADHNYSSVLYCADLHLCAIANARLGYSENFHLLCRKYHQHAPRERHLNGNTITCLCQSMYIYISYIIIFRHIIIYKVTIDALHVIHCLRCFTEIFLKSKRTKINSFDNHLVYLQSLHMKYKKRYDFSQLFSVIRFSGRFNLVTARNIRLLKILETTGII